MRNPLPTIDQCLKMAEEFAIEVIDSEVVDRVKYKTEFTFTESRFRNFIFYCQTGCKIENNDITATRIP